MKDQRSTRRTLTLGWVFILVFFLLILSALNTGTNLLYLVSGAVVSFILLSLVLAQWNLRQLRVFRDAPAAAYRLQETTIQVRVENHKRAVPAVSLNVEQCREGEGLYAHIPRIPALKLAVISIQHIFEKRGVYSLPPLRVKTAFPFGLLEERREFHSQEEIMVYPRIHPVRTGALEHLPGMKKMPQTPASDGGEFFGLRKYQPGDDLRKVSWKISARKGEWITREMGRENARTIYLVLDVRHYAWLDNFEEHFEQAVELTASLAVALLKRRYIVGVITATGMLEGGQGPAQEVKILEFLARLAPVSEANHAPLDEIHEAAESHDAVHLFISPDPALWGNAIGNNRIRVLHPEEFIDG